jgi:hypothetical protein
MRHWRAANRKAIKAYMAQWRADNHDKIRKSDNAWRKSKGEPLKRRKYEYDTKNRAVINANRRRRYHLNKWKPRPIQARIRDTLRKRLGQALKNRKAGLKTLVLLGCSMDDFMLYLESKFKRGMSWENYGKMWHLDHIMPCAIFDLTKPEHIKVCFHFSNLRPLRARANFSKGAKIITDQFNLL